MTEAQAPEGVDEEKKQYSCFKRPISHALSFSAEGCPSMCGVLLRKRTVHRVYRLKAHVQQESEPFSLFTASIPFNSENC